MTLFVPPSETPSVLLPPICAMIESVVAAVVVLARMVFATALTVVLFSVKVCAEPPRFPKVMLDALPVSEIAPTFALLPNPTRPSEGFLAPLNNPISVDPGRAVLQFQQILGCSMGQG